ncbi:MAG: GIY-YIG nuclease family protein [Fluviibacter sp.]
MPYAKPIAGIYKIVNTAKNECYVGQSQNVKKRIAEHFRLLRAGKHINPRLQNSFTKYGENNFDWSLEAVCEHAEDLDQIENAFISGEAQFVESNVYNIADFAKAPMRGKRHTEEAKQRIKAGRRASSFNYRSEEYRKTLSDAQHRSLFSDSKFVAKVKFIIENDSMSYAARGRAIGLDTSSVRKLYLKYKHKKGVL